MIKFIGKFEEYGEGELAMGAVDKVVLELKKIGAEIIKHKCLIALLILLATLSGSVASAKATDLPVFSRSVETLDESKTVVMKVTGATIALSFAITLLPDDWGTPLADSLADMNKYLVFMLGMIYFENLLVTKGIPIIFKYLLPIAFLLLIIYLIATTKWVKKVAIKLSLKIFALSLVLILVVPCGTAISNRLCSGSMSYVNDAITLAEDGADKVEGMSENASEDKSFYERISELFNTAIGGVQDLFNYYKGIVGKFVNSIAILAVAYCVIPVLTFLILFWILNQMLQLESFRSRGDFFLREKTKEDNKDFTENKEMKS